MAIRRLSLEAGRSPRSAAAGRGETRELAKPSSWTQADSRSTTWLSGASREPPHDPLARRLGYSCPKPKSPRIWRDCRSSATRVSASQQEPVALRLHRQWAMVVQRRQVSRTQGDALRRSADGLPQPRRGGVSQCQSHRGDAGDSPSITNSLRNATLAVLGGQESRRTHAARSAIIARLRTARSRHETAQGPPEETKPEPPTW